MPNTTDSWKVRCPTAFATKTFPPTQSKRIEIEHLKKREVHKLLSDQAHGSLPHWVPRPIPKTEESQSVCGKSPWGPKISLTPRCIAMELEDFQASTLPARLHGDTATKVFGIELIAKPLQPPSPLHPIATKIIACFDQSLCE